MTMIRCTVRQLRKLLPELNPNATIDVSVPAFRSFDRDVAIGNARVAFARFRIRCPFCNEPKQGASCRYCGVVFAVIRPRLPPPCPVCTSKRIGVHFDGHSKPLAYECADGHQWDVMGKRIKKRIPWEHER